MTRRCNVAVVGATGLVGQQMMRLLEERRFPVDRFVPIASPQSVGKTLRFGAVEHPIVVASEQAFVGIDVALFSAGSAPSKQWAPVAAAQGALVVDNSSAWRMDPQVPLCVPEVNLEAARQRPKGIVANPNCCAIPLTMVLAPLHREAGLRRVVLSTYQAVSGAGAQAARGFEQQAQAWVRGEPMPPSSLPGQLAGNLLMGWQPDAATGYSEEELKIIEETRKILGLPNLSVSPTAVRVPVANAHGEAVTVELESPLSAARAREVLASAAGVRLVDDFAAGFYPTPLQASGQDAVLVGRLRQDLGNANGLQLWIVADNIRKGAALNAVQVAEALLGFSPE